MAPGVGACANDDCVVIEDADEDLVGLTGRTTGTGEGEGPTPEEGCFAGVDALIGVEPGVEAACAADELAAVRTVGWCAVGTVPWYCCPSSPGMKLRVEQKPSEEVMRRVRPSMDLRVG